MSGEKKKNKKNNPLVPHTVICLPHRTVRMAQGLCSSSPGKRMFKALSFQDVAVRSFGAVLAGLGVCPRLLPRLPIHTQFFAPPTAKSHRNTFKSVSLTYFRFQLGPVLFE